MPIGKQYLKLVKYIAGLIIAACCANVIRGDATLVDADTVRIGTEKIRFLGVDAPESKQTCRCGGETVPCGQRATEALRDFVGKDKIFCEGDEHDRYGRTIGECFISRDGKKISLNRWLVANGWAVAYVAYSKKFAGEERTAKEEKRGLWACEYFQNPAEFRHGKRNRPNTGAKKRRQNKAKRKKAARKTNDGG